MRLRPHQHPHRVDLELGAHGGGLLHLLDAHVDDLELGVGDHDAVTARVARRFDDGEGLGRRGVAGTDHELLLGANLEDVAHGRQRLAVGADDLDAFGSVLEVLDVVVGVEGRQPYDAPEAALHAPHPLHGLGVDAARRPVEGDPAERLDARDVLAHEPGAVGRERDVVLEDDGFRLAGHVRLRGLVVVHGTAERVRRAVSVEVDQAFDRAHRGRRWREDASLGRCALHL